MVKFNNYTQTRVWPRSKGFAKKPMPYGGIPGPWVMIFNDEFRGGSLNQSIWAPNWFGEGGTMNNVATYKANVSVGANGLALLLPAAGQGSLISSNPNGGAATGFQFSYGYLEAMVTFPVNNDWSSFWTDGQNWPITGEFDIAEPENQIMSVGNYHYTGPTTINDPSPIAGAMGTPHIFGLDWQPSQANFYIDGVLHHSITGGIIVSSPQYIIFNHGATSPTDGTGAGSSVYVRYVRVWQH